MQQPAGVTSACLLTVTHCGCYDRGAKIALLTFLTNFLVIDLGAEEYLWPNLPVVGDRLVPVQQLSPVSLAYLGDAVYELFVRTAFLLPPKRSHTYHQEVVAQVRAETQAQHLQALLPKLTEPELTWLKRGRNAAGGGPRRLDPEIYQQATSLETLIGYLYLTNPQRLQELLAEISLVPTNLLTK